MLLSRAISAILMMRSISQQLKGNAADSLRILLSRIRNP